MNGISNAQPAQVKVNQRALVQKVLARYPEEFTVFRELVQNADDAGAENIEIDFQTEEYARKAHPTNGPLGSVDLNQMKIFKWIVRNDGAEFKQEDWDRLISIADGNPDEQKIGAFGVGFYSVFSITDCPLVISGDQQRKLYYDGDQLVFQCQDCEFTKGAVIEMEVKAELVRIPRPFDLSSFLCTALTFLTKVEKVTVLFNGHALSEIQRVRGTPEKIKALPKELKPKRGPGAILSVKSVEMIPQQIRVTLSKAACTAGTTKSRVKKAVKESLNPIKHADFFGKKDVQPNGHVPIPRSLPVPDTRTSIVNYTIYSATVSSAPTEEVSRGIEAATKKRPPRSFLCEVLYFDKDQHGRMMQDGKDDDALGSVFRGAQALCSEVDERTTTAYGSRLFIGQSTAQTSGIATLICSRFIPTVERGSVDLANGYVAEWNKEILYAGGFVARLIYERSMKNIRDQWPESPGPHRDRLREEALYVTKSFTFKSSTPDPKTGELLQNAFFECSDGDLFPILANLGIRNSKDVREPHPTFRSFMKNRPVLDDDLWKEESTLVKQLPTPYTVRSYTFGDVKDELEGRVMTEYEMIKCIDWWVNVVYDKETKGTREKILSYWKLAAPVAKFRSRNSSGIVNISRINKFVDKHRFSFLGAEDPLPLDTIPISFTDHHTPDKIMTALGWEYLTLVDWIRHLVTPGLDKPHDICRDEKFGSRVLKNLQDLWHSIEPTEQDTIIKLMQMVPCLGTNRGHQKPQDVYFPEVDLFNELPVILRDHLPPEYTRNNNTVLDALGVHRFLPWDLVKDRLLSNKECSMMRLATYLGAVERYMGEEFLGVKELPIFACESDEKRRCIGELYYPDSLHLNLGLPVLDWDGSTHAPLEVLNKLGLLSHPPLDVIIQKACSEDADVRRIAWNFFLGHLDDHYEKYDPDGFLDAPFLPCTSGGRTLLSTPEKVYTSSEWETFGFYTIQKAIPVKTRMKLKVKEKPSADAIITAIMSQPKPDERKAKGWFALLAKSGGFSTDKLATLSEMEIVPVPPAPGTKSKTAPLRYTSPSKCFYELPVASKAHHRMIFTYVNFKEPANSFLKTCGAKGNPDCSDIVTAMIENPQEYLNQIEAYIEKQPKSDNHQTHKIYLDDLRQVAAGYHSLPEDVRARMRTAPIFMSFRKKLRTTEDGPSKIDLKEYALKPANEILIPDDLESHRLFGEYIYVAPKEEVFENFYRDHESESLSQHVKHKVMPREFIEDAVDLRYHILDRLDIFLYDQESARRSDFKVSRWKSGAFTVKYCKELEISKSLEFKYVAQPDAIPLQAIQVRALAGIHHTEESDTLWVKHSEGHREDWYDVSVALCRIIFDQHKTHDTLLLMTILDSNLDDLRHRGYDIDHIRSQTDEETQRADQLQGVAYGPYTRITIPLNSFFFPFSWFRNRKKKAVSDEYVYSNMESIINEALSMCESDADMKRSLNTDRSKQKGGKKKADVRYCGSHQMDLERCRIMGKKGMLVYKSHGSEDPPASDVEAFSVILDELGKLFNLGPEKLHIFWYQQDLEMMGFNRNRAIYLNLAHFKEKHADWNSNDIARATMYAAWYFIIAHEIAHNKVFLHDEDHELLFSSIAQHRLVAFKKLLDKRAPGAK